MHKIVVGQSLNRRAASAVADSQGHHRKAQAERHEHTLTKNLILRLGYITMEDGLAADPSGDAFERGIEEMWVSGTRGRVGHAERAWGLFARQNIESQTLDWLADHQSNLYS
jgi:hypothetical protein